MNNYVACIVLVQTLTHMKNETACACSCTKICRSCQPWSWQLV